MRTLQFLIPSIFIIQLGVGQVASKKVVIEDVFLNYYDTAANQKKIRILDSTIARYGNEYKKIKVKCFGVNTKKENVKQTARLKAEHLQRYISENNRKNVLYYGDNASILTPIDSVKMRKLRSVQIIFE